LIGKEAGQRVSEAGLTLEIVKGNITNSFSERISRTTLPFPKRV